MPWPHMPAGSGLVNASASPLVFGQAVYASGAGSFAPAIASALASAIVIGLVAQASIAVGDTGQLANLDTIVGTTTQWDAIAGTTGGLTFGTIYYLSPTAAGMLTATAPTTPGQVVAPLLIGLSPTTALVVIRQPVLL